MGSSSFADSHWDTKNGIGSQIIFVIGVVHLQHHVIDFLLVGRINISLNQCWSNDIVYIVNGFGHTLAVPLVFILVSEFKSFINTWNIEKIIWILFFSLKNIDFFQKSNLLSFYEEMGKMPNLSCDVIWIATQLLIPSIIIGVPAPQTIACKFENFPKGHRNVIRGNMM